MPPFPAVIHLSLVAVAIGATLLLRMVGGSMPWGQLRIAVGPDGRPMRPRVKWYLWSICRGEPPWLATCTGLASILLGGVALIAVRSRFVDIFLAPTVNPLLAYLVVITVGSSSVLVPLGLVVLLRGGADLLARRSSMTGEVVGMRRDIGMFGRSYHIAVQAGNRAMTKTLWAESFRVTRATFEHFRPGDRIVLEYSPRLRHVFHASAPDQARLAG
ncbi:MAG: hypothetical protein M3Z11_05665 [Candidatus Dormibacteraeota bacterium]|nr:hypothetical protein [Candidatus Dormibacteraeota bacterium]